MDTLAILLLIIIIVLILSQQNKILKQFGRLEVDIRELRDQLSRSLMPPAPPAAHPEPASRPPEPATPSRPVPPPKSVDEPPAERRRPPTPVEEQPFVPLPRPQVQKPPVPPPPPSPGFFERHPDLEKFIGENLISKIGIAILVLAIGLFVKYAIDNDWIGPIGRVGIGLLCGGILIGLAHVLRKGYAAFSSVLVGGGLAIFYFTIALAYHQYALFSQTAAFIIMVIITAFAVILSIGYNRQELAIIALVGGFATPFMVSHGDGNYQILFSYLLILNGGLLVMAYHKAWRLLNLLAFIFTALLFVSWLFSDTYRMTPSIYRGGFVFATIFYILFFVINIAHTIRENKKFIASDFGILLANTCFYFGIGLYLLAEMDMSRYQGLFSASMGVFNLAASWFLLRKGKVDSNILYLLVGITLSFVSLTAPLQLHGHYITLFWASESVLLYWLSRRSGIRIIGWGSLLVWVAMLVSLLMDWANVYGSGFYQLPVFFNKGMMTTLYSGACCMALFFMRKRADSTNRIAQIAAIAVGILILFAGGALEIYHQFNFHYPDTHIYALYLILYGFVLISGIAYAGNRWKWFSDALYSSLLLVLGLAVYLFTLQETFYIQSGMLETGHFGSHFAAHWISAALVALMVIRLIAWLRRDKIGTTMPLAMISTAFCCFIVILLSAEGHLLANTCFYNRHNPLEEIERVYYKVGLPILWSLCSFAFMWLGMRYKFKPLRIVSLVLFSLTLLKLFLFDIRNIPIAGKIAAFFCLGVLLLVVSFMYQRLKKIIVEDEEKKIL